jgi:actin-like ATPase involved in cell morphogenesis
VEKRAVIDATLHAGAGACEAYLIEQPLATAFGAAQEVLEGAVLLDARLALAVLGLGLQQRLLSL